MNFRSRPVTVRAEPRLLCCLPIAQLNIFRAKSNLATRTIDNLKHFYFQALLFLAGKGHRFTLKSIRIFKGNPTKAYNQFSNIPQKRQLKSHFKIRTVEISDFCSILRQIPRKIFNFQSLAFGI